VDKSCRLCLFSCTKNDWLRELFGVIISYMIRNKSRLNEFHRKLIEQENISHKKALSIYEALHKEAVSLGVINSNNILEGLEIDLRIAKALNGLTS